MEFLLLLFPVAWLVVATIGYRMAAKRGRSPIGWALICFFLLGAIGLLCLAILGDSREMADSKRLASAVPNP
jgi:hypothetical protein